MIEKKISQYIANQFPAFYQEEGENFILFVKAYYEWLENTGQVTHEGRNLFDYLDVDLTIENFLIYFKEKYLKNIQFNTIANKRMLIKHSLDLHRSKGSPRSFDLFFKLVYGKNIRLDYPGRNIFRTSAATWVRPIFIEVSKNDVSYFEKVIKGSSSTASAFVERMLTKKTSTGSANLLYISNQKKVFKLGEALYTAGPSPRAPFVKGSINSLTIETSTGVFQKGEILQIQSASSDNGKAIVTAVDDGDLISVKVISSGFGYKEETVNLIGENKTAEATVTYGPIGFEEGYYETTEGFLSHYKKLHDGLYTQEFSYEIFSDISFEKYSDILRNSLHVAGTEMFGSIVKNQNFNILSSSDLLVTQTGSSYEYSSNQINT